MKKKRQSWWDKLIINDQIIQEGEKAVLIVMPKDGPFAGYKMWYPKSLVKCGWPYTTIRCGSEMVFQLFNGTKEITMTAVQFCRVQTCVDRKSAQD